MFKLNQKSKKNKKKNCNYNGKKNLGYEYFNRQGSVRVSVNYQWITTLPRHFTSLIFAWTCIIDINNIDNQLDATVTVY